MFYGRFRIRLFAETLRHYAESRTRKAIGPKHELAIMYRELFEAPDAFVNLNPLSQEGRETWGILLDTSKRKPAAAWKLAVEFADWLEKTYQKKDPLQFEDETYSVLLHGELYERLRPLSYVVLKILAHRQGQPVPSEAIIAAINAGGFDSPEPTFERLKQAEKRKQFPDGPTGLKRLSRAIKYLPPELRALIRGQQGVGRQLVVTGQ